jgi:hypothetical protein
MFNCMQCRVQLTGSAVQGGVCAVRSSLSLSICDHLNAQVFSSSSPRASPYPSCPPQPFLCHLPSAIYLARNSARARIPTPRRYSNTYIFECALARASTERSSKRPKILACTQ